MPRSRSNYIELQDAHSYTSYPEPPQAVHYAGGDRQGTVSVEGAHELLQPYASSGAAVRHPARDGEVSRTRAHHPPTRRGRLMTIIASWMFILAFTTFLTCGFSMLAIISISLYFWKCFPGVTTSWTGVLGTALAGGSVIGALAGIIVCTYWTIFYGAEPAAIWLIFTAPIESFPTWRLSVMFILGAFATPVGMAVLPDSGNIGLPRETVVILAEGIAIYPQTLLLMRTLQKLYGGNRAR